MTLSNVSLIKQRYDQIADDYDDRWSRHVELPQKRLTRDLELRSGQRLMDLACGTGRDTVDMLARVTPGEVVAVDCSAGMLKAAERLAESHGFRLSMIHSTAEDAVAKSPDQSFDVVSLRFALAYLNWQSFFGEIHRVLRPGGRLGILTSLATCLPQSREVLTEILKELGGPPLDSNVPESSPMLLDALTAQGFSIHHHWVHPFRLWFDSGARATQWLRDSGYVTHPRLESIPKEILAVIVNLFSERMERFREARGIPLDFELAGVVATR